MRKAIALIPLLVLSAAWIHGQKPTEPANATAILHLRILLTDGLPLWHESEVVIEPIGGPSPPPPPARRSYKYREGTLVVRELVPGRYLIHVMTAGVLTWPVEIVVGPGEQYFTLAFLFGAYSHKFAPPDQPTVSGIVNVRDDRTWLKLVAAYGAGEQETHTDANGQFSFPKVQHGEYVLVATRPQATPVVQQIKVRTEYDALSVNVIFPDAGPRKSEKRK